MKYPNIVAVNVAIHNFEKNMQLYKVDIRNNLSKHAKGISSFNKFHHKLSGVSSGHIIVEKVACMSFDELLSNYKVKKIDLLLIDTEGYDSEIILNINFKEIKPRIIYFEHGISDGITNPKRILQVIDILHKNDYEVRIQEYNVLAFQHNIITN